MLVAFLLTVTPACGGGAASDSSPARAQEPTESQPNDDPPPDIPPTEVIGPQFQVVGDETWMYGGLSGAPGDWAPSRAVQRYGPDGQHLGAVELPLEAGHFLFFSGSYVVDDEMTIVGNTCVVPISENPGCNSPVVPVAFHVTRDGASSLALPDGWNGVRGEDPGDGMVYLRGMIGNDEAVLTRVSGPGPVPDLTHRFETAVVGLSTARANPVAVAEGALTADSVCGWGDWIYTTVPHLDETQQLTSVQVFRQPVDGGFPGLLAEVESFSARAVVGGRVHCLAGALVLQADASPAEFVVIDSASGDQIGDPVQVSSPVPSTWISPDGSRLIVSSVGPGGSGDAGSGSSYYEATPVTGVAPVGALPSDQGEVPHAVVVAGQVVDVAHWGRNPRSEEPPQVVA